MADMALNAVMSNTTTTVGTFVYADGKYISIRVQGVDMEFSYPYPTEHPVMVTATYKGTMVRIIRNDLLDITTIEPV